MSQVKEWWNVSHLQCTGFAAKMKFVFRAYIQYPFQDPHDWKIIAEHTQILLDVPRHHTKACWFLHCLYLLYE